MRTILKRRLVVAGLAAAVLVATWGCQTEGEFRDQVTSQQPTTAETGTEPPEAAAKPADQPAAAPTDERTIDSLREKSVGEAVAVRGEIVRQCPAIGCWFQMKDQTGELFVDLNATEIRLTESRVGQQVQVSGRLVQRGGQLQLEAERVDFGTGQ